VTGALLLATALALAQDAEYVSPAGRRFYARPDSGGVIARAESAAARHPEDADTLLALGFALASRWHYQAAIEVYGRAIARAPDRAVLYRHRGHRSVSLRRFDLAVTDLERAAQLDTASFDIWYHLGLARYLRGDFAGAAAAYRRSLDAARSVDDTVAACDWLWMSLRRDGRADEAAALAAGVGEGWQVVENTAYHLRLLFYSGRRTEEALREAMTNGPLEEATVGYGLGTYLLLQGDTARARDVFRRIAAGPYWPAFGFIAAETDLERSGGPE
jgi:tetratricopeptide (TPR) repeat protein